MKNVFVDTNVFIYRLSASEPQKMVLAKAALEEKRIRLTTSTQVLQEFYSVATRKLGLPREDARQGVSSLRRYRLVTITPELILRAVDLNLSTQISFWDALIVEAAVEAGCSRLLTEDLAHGQIIRGVRVENPFLPSQ